MDVGTERKSLRELLSLPGRDPELILNAIRAGADVDAPGDGDLTPLMLAVLLNDDPAIVRALIEAGADVDAETREGMTALMWSLSAETYDPNGTGLRDFAARDRRRIDTALALVRAGANVNVTCFSPRRMKWTALLFATLEPDRNAAAISAMLEAGADPNARTTEDVAPLFHAAAYGTSSGVVGDLVRAGAEVDAPGKQEGRMGWTPLLYALAGPRKSLPVVEELLKRGASVDVVVGNGQTPLLFAAAIGDDPRYVHALLEAGADVHARDGDGNSALDCAVARNYGYVAARLLRAGAA